MLGGGEVIALPPLPQLFMRTMDWLEPKEQRERAISTMLTTIHILLVYYNIQWIPQK